MRGTRWSFSQKIEDDGRTHFINIPCDNIKQKFRVLELVQAGSYGDTLRCQLWYSDKANNKAGFHPQVYTLSCVQQSKFSKNEKKFYLKSAYNLSQLKDAPNVSRFTYTYRSSNSYFFMYKEPPCNISDELKAKIEQYRRYTPSKIINDI